MNSLTSVVNKTFLSNGNTSTSEATNSESASGLSSSDKISLAVGIPSFIVGVISLIIAVWAFYYAKREFFDKRRRGERERAKKRNKVIMNRMGQGDEGVIMS